MGFDAQNFGFGVLGGWASAYVVYRYRHVVSGIVQSLRAQAETAQNNATRSADSRYINELINRAETTHLAGQFIKLTEILVEPRFLPAPELVNVPDEDIVDDVFRVVPRIHDMPYLHAPYNVPSLSIGDLANGSRALALLGQLGSGRTTALLTIALFSLNRARFKPPTDAVLKLIEAEEAKIPEKDRAQRVQARLKLEAQAREKLAEERGITFTAKDEDVKTAVPLFNRLMPVYIDFAYFDFATLAHGDYDPAEPLVRALQSSVGRITASTIPGNLYSRLTAGQVLLLLDGYDELPPAQQSAAHTWLDAFMREYSSNFIIITGAARGYGGLTRSGFTPVFLRPWQDLDIKQAVEHWTVKFSRFGNKRISKARKPSDDAIAAARLDNRGYTPLELTLKLWALLAEESTDSIDQWHSGYLAKRTPAKAPPNLAETLAKMGELQLDEGAITRARMEALGIGGAVVQAPPADSTDMLRESLEPSGNRAAKVAQKAAADAAKKVASPQAQLLVMLHKSGMLLRYGGIYRFRHTSLAAYLASLRLKDVDFETLSERAAQPAWRGAIAYAALHTSLDKLVSARLAKSPDILLTSLTDVSSWLKYAPADVAWRGAVLKQLSTLLLQPNQYSLVRERVMAALVSARDRSILFILRRAARNANVHLRTLACLAMGAMGDPEAIADIRSLVQDNSSEVQLAAGMALGAIATEDALEAMAIAFTQDSEPVRKAMAEAFAALPDEGHPILYEAIHDDDVLLRRASIAGIRRIRAGWALAAIYRTFLEDKEWYVKSAAEVAFLSLQAEDVATPTNAYPPPANVDWLQAWAQRRGVTIAENDGYEALAHALRDEEPQVRALAAESLGQYGNLDALKSLYEGLLDHQEAVRAASYRALADLQMKLGKPLPAPI